MTSSQPYLFISYAREDDEPFVTGLNADLVAAGVSVWWDRASMESRGRHFLHEIQDAIQHCDRLIAVIGPRALESDYVRYEWEHALLFARAVTPILRAGEYEALASNLPVHGALELVEDLSQLHCPDFRPQRPYQDALDELLRLIRTPVAPLGELHGVPSLPPNFLPRHEQLRALAGGLLRDLDKPYVITSARQTSAIHGMGGIGKSVLATAFARSARVRRAFPDGIVWLPMARRDQETAMSAAMRQLASAMGDNISGYGDKDRSRDRLTQLLENKRCLIILDDLWDLEQAEVFRDVAGPAVRLLITTRIAELVSVLGAQAYEVALPSDEQALSLLATWMNLPVSALPGSAKTIVAACGNLPLAIALIGAMLRDNPDRIEYVLHRLEHADLAKFARRLPNYGHPNLLRALSVSIEALDSRSRAVYMSLAVFPPKTLIPESTLACYLAPDGYDAYDVQEMIDRLIGRSLVRKVGRDRIQLHDLQYAFVIGLCEDPAALHRRLIEAYARACPDGWVSGPDDGYFFQQLPHHLSTIGAHDELHELLMNFHWLQRKLDVLQNAPDTAGSTLLAQDFERALATRSLSPETIHRFETLKIVINQSLHALDDGAPLAQQILARLDEEEDSVFASMRALARGWRKQNWLEPVFPSLTRFDGLLRTHSQRMKAVTEIALLENDEQVICGSLDMYDNIAVVDLVTGKVVKTLSDRSVRYQDTYDGEAGIVALAVSADARILLSCAEHESCVKLWDLETGQVVARLKTPGTVNAIVGLAMPGRAISIAGNQLQLWDIVSQRCLTRIDGLRPTEMSGPDLIDNELESLAVDAHGQYAVAGDREGNLLLFDLEAGRLLNHRAAHKSEVTAVAIDTSCGIAFSGGWGMEESGVRLWRLFDLSPIGVLSEHGGDIDHLALSRDGRWAVSVQDESIAVWRLPERRLVRRYDTHGSSITDLALTNDHRVVVSYIDASIKIWDASSVARDQRSAVEAHSSPILDIAMRQDGQMVASTARRDPDIVLWSVATGTPCGRLSGHKEGGVSLIMAPDGNTLVSADKDGRIIGWDLDAAKELWRLEVSARQISSLALIERTTGLVLVTGDWNGNVLLWDLPGGRAVGALPRREADQYWRSHPAAVRSLSVWPESGQLLVGTENTVEIWDVASLTRLHVYWSVFFFDGHDHYTVALRCLPDGRVVSASTDGFVLVRRVDSRIEEWSADVDNVAMPAGATALAASNDGKYLVRATRQKAVQLLDVAARFRLVGVFVGDSEMLSCACSVDASTIVAGDAEGKVHFLHRRDAETELGF